MLISLNLRYDIWIGTAGLTGSVSCYRLFQSAEWICRIEAPDFFQAGLVKILKIYAFFKVKKWYWKSAKLMIDFFLL